VGSVDGQFSSVFQKLSKLQTKTPFTFAIIVGNLFADPDEPLPEHEESLSSLLDSKISIPLPIYFTVGSRALPSKAIERLESNEGELCPNLTFLGKRSTFKTSEGVRIVTVGGLLSPTITTGLSQDKYLPFHTDVDVKSLHGSHNADIVITTNWPASIQNKSAVKLPQDAQEPASEQCLADLCSALKPRYHFCASPDIFYEREPFSHLPSDKSPDARPTTRFISLASPSSSTKAKWLYAFNLDPAAPTPTAVPAGTTSTPFIQPNANGKRALLDQHASYRYANSSARDGYQHDSKRRRHNKIAPTPQECFFCLSNQALATHMITSIGTDSYLTTAKGPVPLPSTFTSLSHNSSVNFPAHILIIPLAHAPTIAAIGSNSSSADPERKAAFSEMRQYKSSLDKMIAKMGQGRLGSVCFEISRVDGVHVHWQWMPVAADMIESGLLEAGFQVEAENQKLPKLERRDVGDGNGEVGDWFRVWIWRAGEPRASELHGGNGEAGTEDGEEGTKNGEGDASGGTEVSLFLPIQDRIDLQFGRRVMAKLLETPQRAHWKDCDQSRKDEEADVAAFKTAFKEFDFTNDD